LNHQILTGRVQESRARVLARLSGRRHDLGERQVVILELRGVGDHLVLLHLAPMMVTWATPGTASRRWRTVQSASVRTSIGEVVFEVIAI